MTYFSFYKIGFVAKKEFFNDNNFILNLFKTNDPILSNVYECSKEKITEIKEKFPEFCTEMKFGSLELNESFFLE